MKSILFLFIILIQLKCYTQTFKDQTPVKIIKNQEGAILSLAFQNDGKILASGSEDKTCILWSYPDFKLIKTLTGHYSGVQSILYTPNGKYICTTGDRTIRIYSISGDFIKSYGGIPTYIWSISYNAKINKIICGSHDKNIRIVDFANGKLSEPLSGHTKNALAVTYSPDGKLIASGSMDETIRIWDVATKNTIKILPGHGGNVFAITFTSDSKKVISSSNDNTIRIWDVDSGKTIFNLLGHTKGVSCIALSPDNSYLLSGSYDSTIKLWDVNSGECIYTFTGHKDAVNTVTFNPDGTTFASGSSDKTIQIWEIKPEIFVEHYYLKSFEDECSQSGLFAPRGKDETKDNYKIRVDKGVSFKKELIQKYYQIYLKENKVKILK